MTRYLSLAEFWYLTEHVTGIIAATLIRASRVELADSALHAPQAGFGDTGFYPDVYDKAAVLACRIAWNHPLPDGNKRAAWACLVLFIDLNDGSWNDEQPDTDDAVEAMLAVAAREVNERMPGQRKEALRDPGPHLGRNRRVDRISRGHREIAGFVADGRAVVLDWKAR